jgi:hypothetical protein
MNCREQHNTANKYNLKISVNKTKAMAVKGKLNVRNKLMSNNNIIERVNTRVGTLIMATLL